VEFTPVYVSLAQGLKSSIADDAVNPGSGSLILENFVIEQREELVPRDGDVSLSNLDIHGGYIVTPWRLATRGAALLSQSKYGNPNPLYSYSPSRSRWAPVSSTINGPTSYNLTAVAGGKIQTHSKAYLPGYIAIATYDTVVGDAEAIIIDETTGQTLFSAVWTSASGTIGRVRVVACNGLFCFLAENYNDSEIDGYVVDPTNPVGVGVNLSAGLSNIHAWNAALDAIVVGNTVHVAYAAAGLGIGGVTWTPAVGGGTWSQYEITDASTAHLQARECMSFVRDLGGSGKIGLVTVDILTGVKLHWNISAGGLPASSFVMEAFEAINHHTLNVCAHTTSALSGGDVQIVAEFHPSDVFTATCGGSLGGTGWTVAGSGVGKTLTSTATGVQTVDGHTLALNDVVLVTGDASTLHSLTAKDWGLYKVTTAGAIGVLAVLTRATNFDTAAKITRDAIVRVTTGGNPSRQYHVAKVLDDESVGSPGAPGTFTLDTSAIAIAAIDPTFVPGGQITQYRRFDRMLWTSFKTSANSITNAQWTRGLGLTSHAYLHGGKRFIWTNYDNEGEAAHQGSYFLLECPASGTALTMATPQAAFAVDQESGIQFNSHLQDVALNQAGNALGAVLTRTDAVATDDGQRSVVLAEIELNPSIGHHVEVGGSLFTVGGVLGQYDGRNYYPSSFPFAPDGLQVVPATNVGGLGNIVNAGTVNKTGTTPPDVQITGTPVTPTVVWIEVTTGVTFAGGATSAGRFKWSTNRGGSYTTGAIIADTVPLGTTGLTAAFGLGTYATDNKYRTTSETQYRVAVVSKSTTADGRVMRSEPDYKDVTLYAGQSQISLDVVPYYRMGDKPAAQVEIYRSQANVPSLLQLVTTIDSSTGADSTSIVMADSDAAIVNNPLLYTSGDVEPHVAVGGISDLTYHSGRLIGISMDDPTKLLVTTPLVDGEVPAFTDSGAIQVRSKAHAVADYLDSLVVFGDDQVFVQAPSDGPNSQGQGSWPQLQPIEGGSSTAQPLSVCVTPDGLGFVSKDPSAGYQVVTRSLTIEPVGADVQAQLSAANIVNTFHVPKRGQTRIYLDNSTVLVWDHTHQQWSTYTSVPSISSTLWNDKPVYYTNVGDPNFDAARVETPGVHMEGLGLITYRVESPWLQLAVLKSTPYPNVGGFERVRRCIGVGRMLGSSHDLLVQIYADGNVTTPIATYVGTQTTDWNWRIRAVGKCSRIKVRITILNCVDAGVAIRGITLEIGGKKGLQRFGENLPPA
jgi:hypothetical protein